MSAADDGRIEHLLIVRLSAMGDVIHTLPAAQALRQAFPQAMIGWLIEERWAELLCAPGSARRGARSAERPLVDWVHTVDLKAWRKSLLSAQTLEHVVRVWNDVRDAQYEIAVDLQGAIRSAVLASWSGAPIVYGARDPREAPAALWYTRQTAPRAAHVVEQNLSIVEALIGKKMDVPAVEFPADLKAEEKIERLLRHAGIADFAILNPGAGWGAKQWPAERYGHVARLLSKCGMQSVVNYGPGEQDLAQKVQEASAGAAQAWQLSISQLIALTRKARLFVGGDTGPLHLAAALKIPVVAIFGPTNPARNGPYGTSSVVLRNPASTTTHVRNSHSDEAMLAISAEAVIEAAQSLLVGCAAGDSRG